MGRSLSAPTEPSAALPACGTPEENKTTLFLLLPASDNQVFALPEVFVGSGAGLKPPCREPEVAGALGGLLSWLDAVPGTGQGGFWGCGLGCRAPAVGWLPGKALWSKIPASSRG